MNLPRMMLTFALLATLAGCASVPAPLTGEYSQAFFPEQATSQSVGARVRWGGTVVETEPGAERTCIEILARELDRSARPRDTDRAHGRFLACRGEFIDPEIFTNGREVTVVGRLEGFRDGTVGEFAYEYPVIDAASVYLWPERVEAYWTDRGYHYHGWGWPYYWPYYRYPYFHSYYVVPPRPRAHVRPARPMGDAGGA